MNSLLLHGKQTGIEKLKIWPTNYLTTVDVREKVGKNTRGFVECQ